VPPGRVHHRRRALLRLHGARLHLHLHYEL
jgi:hypothetical protein